MSMVTFTHVRALRFAFLSRYSAHAVNDSVEEGFCGGGGGDRCSEEGENEREFHDCGLFLGE
jgi:hypothetical protein